MATPENDHRLRPAHSGDYPLFVRFFQELGLTERPTPEDVWQREVAPQTYFLEDPRTNEALAYAQLRFFETETHVVHVVTAPEHRRKGLGRTLMKALARIVRERGHARWFLNVKSDNTAALALYAHSGMTTHSTASVLGLKWSDVSKLPPSPARWRIDTPGPEADAEIEKRFALSKGEVASLRQSAGSHLFRVRRLDDDMLVGFARFNPSVPGAKPFRIDELDGTRALLEAFHLLARPGDEQLQLVTEDEPGLTAFLRDAGADLRFELVQLAGAVP